MAFPDIASSRGIGLWDAARHAQPICDPDGVSRQPPPVVAFPLKPDSVRFAVIGDSGTGESPQYEVAQQMVSAWDTFPFDFAVMLGDNIYHGYSSRGFSVKFEQPYHVLLDVGVKFYASLGNHDDPSACLYKPFNMGGQRY